MSMAVASTTEACTTAALSWSRRPIAHKNALEGSSSFRQLQGPYVAATQLPRKLGRCGSRRSNNITSSDPSSSSLSLEPSADRAGATARAVVARPGVADDGDQHAPGASGTTLPSDDAFSWWQRSDAADGSVTYSFSSPSHQDSASGNAAIVDAAAAVAAADAVASSNGYGVSPAAAVNASDDDAAAVACASGHGGDGFDPWPPPSDARWIRPDGVDVPAAGAAAASAAATAATAAAPATTAAATTAAAAASDVAGSDDRVKVGGDPWLPAGMMDALARNFYGHYAADLPALDRGSGGANNDALAEFGFIDDLDELYGVTAIQRDFAGVDGGRRLEEFDIDEELDDQLDVFIGEEGGYIDNDQGGYFNQFWSGGARARRGAFLSDDVPKSGGRAAQQDAEWAAVPEGRGKGGAAGRRAAKDQSGRRLMSDLFASYKARTAAQAGTGAMRAGRGLLADEEQATDEELGGVLTAAPRPGLHAWRVVPACRDAACKCGRATGWCQFPLDANFGNHFDLLDGTQDEALKEPYRGKTAALDAVAKLRSGARRKVLAAAAFSSYEVRVTEASSDLVRDLAWLRESVAPTGGTPSSVSEGGSVEQSSAPRRSLWPLVDQPTRQPAGSPVAEAAAQPKSPLAAVLAAAMPNIPPAGPPKTQAASFLTPPQPTEHHKLRAAAHLTVQPAGHPTVQAAAKSAVQLAGQAKHQQLAAPPRAQPLVSSTAKRAVGTQGAPATIRALVPTPSRESCPLISIDTEWRPNFTAGEAENEIALIQMATARRCLLVRVSKMPELTLRAVPKAPGPVSKLAASSPSIPAAAAASSSSSSSSSSSFPAFVALPPTKAPAAPPPPHAAPPSAPSVSSATLPPTGAPAAPPAPRSAPPSTPSPSSVTLPPTRDPVASPPPHAPPSAPSLSSATSLNVMAVTSATLPQTSSSSVPPRPSTAGSVPLVRQWIKATISTSRPPAGPPASSTPPSAAPQVLSSSLSEALPVVKGHAPTSPPSAAPPASMAPPGEASPSVKGRAPTQLPAACLASSSPSAAPSAPSSALGEAAAAVPDNPLTAFLRDRSLRWAAIAWDGGDNRKMQLTFGFGKEAMGPLYDVCEIARACGYGSGLGAARLAHEVLGVAGLAKPKSVTRSNWAAAAALTQRQLRYAALDGFLPGLIFRQLRALHASPRMRCAWCLDPLSPLPAALSPPTIRCSEPCCFRQFVTAEQYNEHRKHGHALGPEAGVFDRLCALCGRTQLVLSKRARELSAVPVAKWNGVAAAAAGAFDAAGVLQQQEEGAEDGGTSDAVAAGAVAHASREDHPVTSSDEELTEEEQGQRSADEACSDTTETSESTGTAFDVAAPVAAISFVREAKAPPPVGKPHAARVLDPSPAAAAARRAKRWSQHLATLQAHADLKKQRLEAGQLRALAKLDADARAKAAAQVKMKAKEQAAAAKVAAPSSSTSAAAAVAPSSFTPAPSSSTSAAAAVAPSSISAPSSSTTAAPLTYLTSRSGSSSASPSGKVEVLPAPPRRGRSTAAVATAVGNVTKI